MADFELVLKHWGPVEADYSTHGNLVLTRSVALIILDTSFLQACELWELIGKNVDMTTAITQMFHLSTYL